MKTKIEFNNEEREQAECAFKGLELKIFHDNVFKLIREKIKYGNYSDEQKEVLEELREQLADDAITIENWTTENWY